MINVIAIMKQLSLQNHDTREICILVINVNLYLMCHSFRIVTYKHINTMELCTQCKYNASQKDFPIKHIVLKHEDIQYNCTWSCHRQHHYWDCHRLLQCYDFFSSLEVKSI